MTGHLLSPKVAICIVAGWIVIVIIIFINEGFFGGSFFQFGPSERVKFFNKTVDTWGKWWGIAIYTIINQLITTYGLETITPWMINQVQNTQVGRLDTSDRETISIVLAWYVYLWLSRVIGIQLLLSQIDFLLLVLLADLVTTYIVVLHYLREKKKLEYNEELRKLVNE